MKEELIDGKRVWTYCLKELVGDDPLAQICYERQMEWRKMLKEGKTREEIAEYMEKHCSGGEHILNNEKT